MPPFCLANNLTPLFFAPCERKQPFALRRFVWLLIQAILCPMSNFNTRKLRQSILATLVYIRDGDKTLMLHRVKKENDYHRGKWNGLGGKFEPGESPEDCAVREVMEESGLTITRPELRGHIVFPLFDGENDWYVYLFQAIHWSGTLLTNPPEGNLAWLTPGEIENIPLWEGDRIFLPWLDEPGIFSAVFTYRAKKLRNYCVSWYGRDG